MEVRAIMALNFFAHSIERVLSGLRFSELVIANASRPIV
jgi:hypothetical protein